MQNNVQTNIPAIIEIAENTNQFHQRLAVEICQEFGGFLKIHPVISSEKYQVSQLKFRKGGIKAFLQACQEENNQAGKKIRDTIGSKYNDATTSVAILGALLMARLNVINTKRNKKFHYGLRLRSNNQLGIYLTIGVQDLESFFERGKEIAQKQLETRIADSAAHLVDPQAIAEVLGYVK